MSKKETYETLAKDEEGNWIEVHLDEDGDPEWYALFLVENMILINMLPDNFEKVVELFMDLV